MLQSFFSRTCGAKHERQASWSCAEACLIVRWMSLSSRKRQFTWSAWRSGKSAEQTFVHPADKVCSEPKAAACLNRVFKRGWRKGALRCVENQRPRCETLQPFSAYQRLWLCNHRC